MTAIVRQQDIFMIVPETPQLRRAIDAAMEITEGYEAGMPYHRAVAKCHRIATEQAGKPWTCGCDSCQLTRKAAP